MKRIALAATVLALAVIAAAYYRLPHLFKEPLAALNRVSAGLSEKVIRVGSHDVHYLEGGSGETVVLLHGIFAEKDHWVDFARPLTDRYRVVAPDLPGFGESGRLDNEDYDYATQVERLKQLLDRLDIARAHLAGNSMGGTIAALFAIRYPERVATVAFIGAPHGIRSPTPSDMDSLIDAGGAPLVARDEAEFERMLSLVFVQRPFLPYPILHDAQAGALQNAQSNLRIWQRQLKDRYLLQDRIGELRTRTFLLWGQGDRIFDVSAVDTLRSRLQKVQVNVLPDIGHLPMMEAPKETARLYAAFLSQ
ncbi:alpha/beta fold hydrolase [Noviherbaspirillum sp.]|uniref:alpha/beta fold hydrolase n=1 Tax=Noviherbaspirillum sp. TaxID=1926288 RepID=UPI002FE27EBC